MSAPGDILVRKVDGGWIVSTGIEADGWFVTSAERVVAVVQTILDGGGQGRLQDEPTAIDALRSVASKIDRLTLAIAAAENRRAA